MEIDRLPQRAAEVARSRLALNQITPEFIRLPRTGHLCPHVGLTRAKLNQLILPCPDNGFSPPVRSVSMGQAGKKGVRLIEYASLMRYLHGLKDGQSETREDLEVVA